MNNSINNSPVSFQAKMILADDLAKNANFQKIAKEFEAKTAKKYPNYEVSLGRPDGMSQDKLSIAISRGGSDNLSTREYVLAEGGTKNFMKLSDSKIIQKLAKLLSVVKRSDKFYDNFEKDSNKLAGKYGIDFSQDAFDAMYDDAVYQIEAISAEKLSKDPILSDLSTV